MPRLPTEWCATTGSALKELALCCAAVDVAVQLAAPATSMIGVMERLCDADRMRNTREVGG